MRRKAKRKRTQTGKRRIQQNLLNTTFFVIQSCPADALAMIFSNHVLIGTRIPRRAGFGLGQKAYSLKLSFSVTMRLYTPGCLLSGVK